jgi:hypothetical protein
MESLREYVEPNIKNLPPFKMPRRRREWDNIETTSENNKARSQLIGWNAGKRRWKRLWITAGLKSLKHVQAI